MEDFDTPGIIPKRGEDQPAGDTLAVRVKLAGDTLARGLDAVGQLAAPAAKAWQKAAAAREDGRTDENLAAVRDANRARLEAMRDLRRDVRAFEKARGEVPWWNVFNGERRAAKSVVRDSRQLVQEATAARRQARKAYPLSLPALAVRCHAAHLVPTGVWAAVSDGATASVALWSSVAAVAFNVAAVRLGSRHAATGVADADPDALRPSQEEAELLRRLSPKVWPTVAQPRGLADVVSSGATLTVSGIQAKLTLNGTMDIETLRKRVGHLRAALRLREGTRLELRDGATGGHARLTLRTRSAADGVSLDGWQPGDPWGVDTVTGETFPVPLGRRMLIAGTSGSGKSWSARPILAEASSREDHRLVVLDMKRVEARLWQHRARVAITREEIQAVLGELVDEMYDRLDSIPVGADVVTISPSVPRILVFVDEGSELMSVSKKDFSSIIEDLRTLARMARAAEIILVWATQKPLLTGDAPGLDTQVAGQITCRMSLAVATQKESMTIFGDDAVSEGWLAHKLPMPGVGMLRDSNTAKPHHLKMRAMSPKDVMRLPAGPVWSRRVSSTGATVADLDTRRKLEAAGDPWAGKTVGDTATVPDLLTKKVRVSAEDRDDQLMEELTLDPCRSMSSMAAAIGASKSVVKRRLEQMAADGLVCKDENDCWHPVH